jgi:Holliday junction resolvase-like predicted endonuclease
LHLSVFRWSVVSVNAEENLAARFLRLAGYQVLSRNDRRFFAEIDLLVRSPDSAELCIVEVKRRRHDQADFPLISDMQRQRLTAAAGALMQEASGYMHVRMLLLVVDATRQSAEIIGDITLGDR